MLFAAHRTFVIQSLNSYAIARVGVLLTRLEVKAVCVQSFIEAYCRSEQKETASATPQTVTWRTFQVVFLCLQRTFHMSHLEEEQWLWHWDTVVNIHKAKSAPLCSLWMNEHYNRNSEKEPETLYDNQQRDFANYNSFRRT